MSAVAERAAIGTLFVTTWGATTPVVMPNEEYKPDDKTPWVRLSYRKDEAYALEIGYPTAAQERQPGVLFIQVFVPVDSGDGYALQLAEQAAAVFRGKFITAGSNAGLRFRRARISSAGPDGVWYQVVVSIPFYMDAVYL